MQSTSSSNPPEVFENIYDNRYIHPYWTLTQRGGKPIKNDKTENRSTNVSTKGGKYPSHWEDHNVIIRELLQNVLDAVIHVRKTPDTETRDSFFITWNCVKHNDVYKFFLNGKMVVQIQLTREGTNLVLKFVNMGNIMPVEGLLRHSKKTSCYDDFADLKKQYVCGGFGSGLKNSITALFSDKLSYDTFKFITYHPYGEINPINGNKTHYRLIDMKRENKEKDQGFEDGPEVYTMDISNINDPPVNKAIGSLLSNETVNEKVIKNFHISKFEASIMKVSQEKKMACTFTIIRKSFDNNSNLIEDEIQKLKDAFDNHIVCTRKEKFDSHFTIRFENQFLGEVYVVNPTTENREEKNIIYGFPGLKLCETSFSNVEEEKKFLFNINTNLMGPYSLPESRAVSFDNIQYLIGKILCACLTENQSIRKIINTESIENVDNQNYTQIFKNLIEKCLEEKDSIYIKCITKYLVDDGWLYNYQRGPDRDKQRRHRDSLKTKFSQTLNGMYGSDCTFIDDDDDRNLLVYINNEYEKSVYESTSTQIKFLHFQNHGGLIDEINNGNKKEKIDSHIENFLLSRKMTQCSSDFQALKPNDKKYILVYDCKGNYPEFLFEEGARIFEREDILYVFLFDLADTDIVDNVYKKLLFKKSAKEIRALHKQFMTNNIIPNDRPQVPASSLNDESSTEGNSLCSLDFNSFDNDEESDSEMSARPVTRKQQHKKRPHGGKAIARKKTKTNRNNEAFDYSDNQQHQQNYNHQLVLPTNTNQQQNYNHQLVVPTNTNQQQNYNHQLVVYSEMKKLITKIETLSLEEKKLMNAVLDNFMEFKNTNTIP
jgi:hypothetical protein